MDSFIVTTIPFDHVCLSRDNGNWSDIIDKARNESKKTLTGTRQGLKDLPEVRLSFSSYFSKYSLTAAYDSKYYDRNYGKYHRDTLLESIVNKEKLHPSFGDLSITDGEIHFYSPGCFFKRHSDSRRNACHVGTLVVVFPKKLSPHEGGKLILHPRNKDSVVIEADQEQFTVVIMSLDLEHEVTNVISGERIIVKFEITINGKQLIFNNSSLASQVSFIDNTKRNYSEQIENIENKIEKLELEIKELEEKKKEIENDIENIVELSDVPNVIEMTASVEQHKGNVVVFIKEAINHQSELYGDTAILWNELVKKWPLTYLSVVNVERKTDETVREEKNSVSLSTKDDIYENRNVCHKFEHYFNDIDESTKVFYFFNNQTECFEGLSRGTEYNDSDYDVKITGYAACFVVQKTNPNHVLSGINFNSFDRTIRDTLEDYDRENDYYY